MKPKVASITPLEFGKWIAHITPSTNQTFIGDTPNEAAECAEQYIRSMIQKAEPKPPRRWGDFVEVGSFGEATPGSWNEEERLIVSVNKSTGNWHVFNVAADFTMSGHEHWVRHEPGASAAKRETREEAEKRWKAYQVEEWFSHYGSFMRGAGFDPEKV